MSSIVSTTAHMLPLIAARIISPVPIIVMVLLLSSRRGRLVGGAYLLGWTLVALVIGAVIIFSEAQISPEHKTKFAIVVDIADLLFGSLFLLLSLRMVHVIARNGQLIDVAKWINKVESISGSGALWIGAFMATIGSPKNTALVLQVVADLAMSGLGIGAKMIVFVIFVLAGSIGLVIPYAAYVIFGQHADRFLVALKEWMVRHENAVLLILFIFLSAYFFAKGWNLMWEW